MTPAALKCRGLVKRYGDTLAVAGLDLEVGGGECFGLLGPNGAGKTTTVEIFEGLRAADEGDIEVLGDHWRGDGIALRQRLGIQLQETKFPEKLRVHEVVALFRSFYPRGLSVGDVLRLVALEEKANAYVRTLSGGQKQRLSLGCALAGDPELLFLDEPTTGLDPQSRRQTWEIVESLKARGRSVLLTTHYMNDVDRPLVHFDRRHQGLIEPQIDLVELALPARELSVRGKHPRDVRDVVVVVGRVVELHQIAVL